MKRFFPYACALALAVICLPVTQAFSGPEEGVLVDEAGDRIAGYSPVIVEDGVAYPVCSEKDDTWYTVDVVGESADGTILCTLGYPMDKIPEDMSTGDGGPGEEVTDTGQ
jgi:hypothetical protein